MILRRVLTAWLVFSLVSADFIEAGYGQGYLEYRYGNAPTGGSAGSEQNQRLRQGVDQAFGGGSSGVIGGAIGSSVPDPAESGRRLQYENERRTELEKRWRDVQNSPTISPGEYLRSYNERQKLEGLRSYAIDKNPDHLRKWISSDPNFRRQAGAALYDLRSSNPGDATGRALQEAGEAAVVQADAAYSSGLNEEASLFFSVARATADILVGIDPVTGTLRAVYESVTGTNLITGEELSDFERGLAIFSVATLGFGSEIDRGITLVEKVLVVVKNSRAVQESVVFAKFIAKQFAAFRRDAKAEEAASRFIGMLVEAGSGPWARAKDLGADYSKVANGIHGPHAELFELDNVYVKQMNIGKATRAEADAVGLAFVGENHTVTTYRQDNTVKIYYSQDGRRQYRSPAWKPDQNRFQANLETYAPAGSGRKSALSNAHIDITD